MYVFYNDTVVTVSLLHVAFIIICCLYVLMRTFFMFYRNKVKHVLYCMFKVVIVSFVNCCLIFTGDSEQFGGEHGSNICLLLLYGISIDLSSLLTFTFLSFIGKLETVRKKDTILLMILLNFKKQALLLM